MRKDIITTLSIVFCIVTLLLISQYFFSIPEPARDAKFIESIFTPPVSDFQPEPNERKLFILSILLTPILCGLFYILLSHARIQLSRRIKFYIQLLLITVPILLYLLVYYSMGNTVFPFLAISSFHIYPFLTFISVILLLFILIASHKLDKLNPPLSRWLFPILYYVIGLLLILLVALETVHNDTESILFVKNSFEHLHFTAYFDALAQTYLGKSPVTLNPQYGYYPTFLNPIFKVVGLSVLTFTLLMGMLKIIAYLGLLITLRNSSNHWLVALIGFSAMLFYTRIRVPLDINTEPYFQYNPHRLLFPALLIFLVWLYISRKNTSVKKIIYGLTTLTSAISVLWNPDTGIIVFAGWLAVLGYLELLQLGETGIKRFFQKVLLHMFINLSALGLIILMICAQSYFQIGTWPNLIENFQYASLFYNYGFYMLPLPRRLHPWMWVILPYIVGIYLSIRHLLDVNKQGVSSVPNSRSLNDRSTLIFTISIIGIGIFTYYQGRSHNYNLISVSWPAYLLFTLFTDQLLTNLIKIIRAAFTRETILSLLGRYAHQVIFFGILFYFLGSSVTSIAIHFPAYVELIATRLTGLSQANQSMERQAEFINQTSTEKNTVLLLTDEATELYLYTGHPRPLDIPGFSEFILNANVETLNSFLRHPPQGTKIYWDTSFQLVNPQTFTNLRSIASSDNLILFESTEQ